MATSGEGHAGENKSRSSMTENPVESPAVDVENPSVTVSSIVGRWEREDLLKKGNFVFRALALLFSLLSFAIMGSNKHGDWKNFDKYEEYRYCLAISILAFLYTGCQILLQMQLLLTGKQFVSRPVSSYLDFLGDQIVAYLLISALSAAVPMTNRMREGADNIFTDSIAASISMAFFAFVCLALSALVSGFKLSHLTYI